MNIDRLTYYYSVARLGEFPTCAWSGYVIGPDDRTAEDVDGDTILLSVAEGCGVQPADCSGEWAKADECVYYEHGDCYHTRDYWDSSSIEAADGRYYLPEDVSKYAVYDSDDIFVCPPHTTPGDFDRCTCDDCGCVCDEDEIIVTDDGYWCPDHAPEDAGLMSYNEDVLDHLRPVALGKPYSKRSLDSSALPFMGVELEIEAHETSVSDVLAIVGDCHYAGQPVGICKQDGSLGHDGVEIVSAPMLLDDHRRAWPSLVSRLRKAGAASFDNTSGRCGLHVHISKRAFQSDLHIARFCHLIADPSNQKLSECVAQRTANSFCRFYDKRKRTKRVRVELPEFLVLRHLDPTEKHPCKYERGTSVYEVVSEDVYLAAETWRRLAWLDLPAPVQNPSIAGYREHRDHYDACAPSSQGTTVEVRIYKGTLHKSGVIRAVEHVHSAWRFTSACGIQECDSASYIQWLLVHRSEYQALCSYLWRRSREFQIAAKQANLTSGQILKFTSGNKESEAA